MSRLRSTWGLRLVAVFLAASLLPVMVAPTAQAARRAATLSYADWLQSQLAAPAGEAFEQALQTAIETDAASIDAFLSAFASAFERQAPGVRLARIFSAHDALSNEALILYLKGRFHRLVGDLLIPFATFVSAQVHAHEASGRFAALLPAAVQQGLSFARTSSAGLSSRATVFVFSLRTRCTAQPLGP